MPKTVMLLMLSAMAVLQVQAATYCVDASRADDTGAGTSWATAKKTIQAAVNLTADGDTVLVTNGVYKMGSTVIPGSLLSNRVAITTDIAVRSVNGPLVTVVEGSGTNVFGTASALRCVYMSKGRMEGFTLQSGATCSFGQPGGSESDHAGGGVYVERATQSACLTNCIIQQCMASCGGGCSGGTLYRCTLSGNTASIGSHADGGGAYGGTLYNCTLSGNSAHDGGGAADGRLYNCVVSGNTASRCGGGAAYSTLYNCTLSGNEAAHSGGGGFWGTLFNCTLSDNTAPAGGGSAECGLRNCVVWGNTLPDVSTENYSGSTFLFSCTTPLMSGTGNISSDPLFVDAANGDYRLELDSPCIDAGSDAYVDGSTDLLGNPRIQGASVDMGAYEISSENVPFFSPPSGTVFTSTLSLSISFPAEGASIRYTLDGTTPTVTSSLYGGVITLTQSTTVKAKAFNKDGFAVSPTATASYLLCVAEPVFSPQSGTVTTNVLAFTLSCPTAGASVYYTTNGADPTESSALFTNAVALTHSAAVKAKAFKDGMAASATVTAAYTVIQVVATPQFEPATGATGTNVLSVTLSCATPGSTIRYTQGGSTPTPTNELYSGPITLYQSATILAKAFKSGAADSDTAAASYTVVETVAGEPTFFPLTGTTATNSLSVTLVCVTPGATVRYTLDGSEPSGESLVYVGAITLTQSATVKAKAFKAGLADSTTAAATYTVCVAEPVFDPPAGSVAADSLTFSLSCLTAGAAIYYTTNGADPTRSSALFTNAVTLTHSAAVKAKAFKDGMAASATAAAAYTIVETGFDIVAVKVLSKDGSGSYSSTRFQPVLTDEVGVEARLGNMLFAPSNIQMYVTYFIGTNVWGVDNWPASQTVTKPMYPTADDPSVYRTSTSNDIPALRQDQIVQYHVWATYLAGRPVYKRQVAFENPSWYFPVDLNQTYAAQGWSPYYIVYGVPPGAVWINEINAVDSATNSTRYVGENQYIEIAVPAAVDLTGWQVDLVDYFGAVTTVPIANAPPQVDVTNGYAFFVIGEQIASRDPQVPPLPKMDLGVYQLSYAMPNLFPGGLRLRRPLGMYEHTIAYDWAPTIPDLSGADWAAEDPEGKFVYVGIEEQGGSLSVTNTAGQSIGDWVFPMTWTPGAMNVAQVVPSAETTMRGIHSAAAPVFSSASGSSATNSCVLTIGCSTEGATIRYTLDGSEPTSGSAVYEGAITLTRSATVRAKASKALMLDSASVAASYTVIWATGTTPVPVPFAWLDQYPVLLSQASGDYEVAAFADADGDGHVAWQEYVTGSVPTNRESVLRTRIGVSNGSPWIAWAPDLGTARVYTVAGKTNLTDAAWGPTNNGSGFFRVRVDLP